MSRAAYSSRFILRKHSDLFDLNRFVRFLSIGHSFWGRSVEWEIQQICSNIFCYFSAHLTRLYIKPQPKVEQRAQFVECFYWRLYIKPQPPSSPIQPALQCFYWRLYIKPQPATPEGREVSECFYWRLYIKPQQLLQNRGSAVKCFYWRLYIKPQRHHPLRRAGE